MNEKSNTFLETEPAGSLMRSYAIPCIISLLVASPYNIVDQIFIANATYLGSYGNAANTVVFPLTVVALALAVMIGDGCCAFVSISLGSGAHDDAHRSIGCSVILCIIVSLVVTAAYLVFDDPILTMFGGSPRFAMAATVSGAVVNIILDPLFIFGFSWGMMGAAVATVLGQVLTAGLSVWYLCRMKAARLQRCSFVLSGRLMRRFLPLGICSFLSQISIVAAMAAVNNMLRKYGALDPTFSQAQYAQIPMAVQGIVMKFFQIIISVAVGLAAGCIPIVGYSTGAGRNDRAKRLFKLLLLSEAAVGAAALVVVECFPRELIAIFGAANESEYYTLFALRAFRIYLSTTILACVNKATFIYLQSLGRALLSTLLSMAREVLFGVGFALLLPVFFGLDGILLSMPVSDVLTFFFSVAVIVYTNKVLSKAQ